MRNLCTMLAVGVAVTSLFAAQRITLAAFTLDRNYQLGDSAGENAAAGAAVGSGAGAGGFTFDSAGLPGQLQFVDLEARNGPTYASVAGRPLGGSGLGSRFDGIDDFLQGERLGLPATSLSATGGAVAGTLDYDGIANRGLQFWVRPEAAGQGRLQSLVNDTSQHGVAISAGNTWVMRYGGAQVDSGVSVPFDAWSHVMLVRPFGAAGGARLYVDGVAVAARGGGYDGANEFPLVVGANTGNLLGDPAQFPGVSEFFQGTIDNLEMFVLGVSTTTQTDYGTFDFRTDNEFAAAVLADYVPGDATGDGLVQGNGSGGANDDVAAFVGNWRHRNALGGVAVGDIDSPAVADFNFDGVTDLLDWDLLVNAHPNGSALNLGALLSGVVPEPTALGLAATALVAVARRRRHSVGRTAPRRRGSLVVALATVGALCCSGAGTAQAQISFGGVLLNTGGDVRAAATLVGPNAGMTYDGSLFFNADSVDQNSSVNNPNAGNPFGDDELRDNLPSYISAGPGAQYAGVSGGWNYQQVLDDFGPQFESGVATIPAGAPGAIVELTVGAGAPQKLLLGILTDNLDGTAFVPSSIAVRRGGQSALAATLTPNLNSDLYFFLVENVAENDVLHIDLGPGPSIPTIAGIQFANGANFVSLFDPDPILTIDRNSGALTLKNGTAGAIDFRAYEILSPAGALNPGAWQSITDAYDANSGGAIDSGSNWLEFTSPADRDNLAEAQQPGPGVALAQGATVNLGNAWLPSPTEDVTMRLLQTDGTLREVQVTYAGNDGNRLPVGDFNADGALTVADWNLLKPLINGDLTGLSPVERYRRGDLNADGRVNLTDAWAFAAAFDTANGDGALAAALAAVPEPSALVSACCAGLAVLARRRRPRYERKAPGA